MRPPMRPTWSLCLIALALAAGCGKQPRNTGNRPKIETRETIGKTTQDIKPMAPQLEQGGQVAETKVTAKDPITLSGNAYVVAVGQIAANNVKHAIDLYQAEHGEYPKNHQEFMDLIIKPGKPDGIQLPQLPYYQEYSYDEKEHKLIVLEYPDRKAQFQAQQDERFGRR